MYISIRSQTSNLTVYTPTSVFFPLQLVAVPEHSIFLGLSDGEVFFGDIETFTILGHISKSRGALHFAVDWQHIRPRAGFGRELRIAIATRRKLQLYEWKRNTFVVIKVSQDS